MVEILCNREKPKLIKAKLVKSESDDGLISTKEGVELGGIYDVDIDSIRTETFLNTDKRVFHRKEIIDVFENGKFSGWFPTELLDMKYGESQNNNTVSQALG